MQCNVLRLNVHKMSIQKKKNKRLRTKQLDFCSEAEYISLPIQEDLSIQKLFFELPNKSPVLILLIFLCFLGGGGEHALDDSGLSP